MANNCPCCNNNSLSDTEKKEYQLLSLDLADKLEIIPHGNSVHLCSAVKYCETQTGIEEFRLVGDSFLEIVYRGENDTPVSKLVDLSGLTVNVTPFDVSDSNTVDLILNGNELTANVKIDPASTADVSASAEGLLINLGSETLITANDTDSIQFIVSGVNNHTIEANLVIDDTDSVDLEIGGSGLRAGVRLSNDPKQLITLTPDGLFVSSDDIADLIEETQAIEVEAPLVFDDLTNTLSIPLADEITDGYLQASDFITFRDKVDPARRIETTGPLTGGGDLSADLTIGIVKSSSLVDGYLSAVDYSRFDSKLDPSRAITTLSPLLGGGSLTADLELSIQQAQSGQDGYLLGTDWVNFNDKTRTALNVGTGAGVFKQKNANKDLELRTITATAGQLIVTQGANSINISIDPSFNPGTGTGADLQIENEGVALTGTTTSIDFVGGGVTATNSGEDVTVTIPGPDPTIDNVTYANGIYAADIADADKVVFLVANSSNLVYNIDPAVFIKRKIILYTLSTDPYTVTISADSGTISGVLDYITENNECVTIYSDGTNLFAIAKN